MSETDMEKGTRWVSEISSILSETAVGIICVTPENINSPWLAFEAGALSKALSAGRVCTYLFDLAPANLPFPLAMFQATEANKADTKALVCSINASLAEHGLSEPILDASFEQWWPSLESSLNSIPTAFVTNKSIRSDRELLEEMLSLVRSQVNDRHEHEVISRIQSIRSVVTELALTIKQSTAIATPEARRRAVVLRAELEQAGQAFSHLIRMMDDPVAWDDGSRTIEAPAGTKNP
jgi:hypothetical protein